MSYPFQSTTSSGDLSMTVYFPNFLAIQTDHPEALQRLSPRLMHWKEGVWLVDLQPTHRYWEHHLDTDSDDRCQQLFAYWQEQEILPHYWRISTGDNPWKCILLLSQMQARGLAGFMHNHNPFGRRLVEDISWGLWETNVYQLAEYLDTLKVSGFRLTSFQKKLRSLIKNTPRLGFQRPHHIASMPKDSIRKRFGGVVETILSWSNFNDHGSDEIAQHPWPWISHMEEKTSEVHRHLDDELSDWQSIETFMQKDLDRLCQHKDFDEQDLIFSLEWSIVLSSRQTRSIQVSFRHPHSLHREIHHHKTTLLQAQYCLQNFQKSSEEEDGYHKSIVGWTIKVREKLRSVPVANSLFEHCSSLQRINDLENMLPIPIASFRCTSHWAPEYASTTKEDGIATNLLIDKQQVQLGSIRPLLVYRKAFDHHPTSSRSWSLLERTMNHWWESSGSPNNEHRNYYQVRQAQGETLWVFRTDQGETKTHGIFA